MKLKGSLQRFNPLRLQPIYYIALIHFIFFFSLTYIRWRAHSPTMDYHAYVQMLWNTVHGNMLFYNQGRDLQVPFFRLHFSPFLVFMAAIYFFIRHPLTIYFIFNIFIAASIIPVFLIARDTLKNKLVAYLITFVYILYPPFVWSHRQGFAEEAFATPLIIFAIYFLIIKRKWLYVFFSLLTLCLRINMTLPIFMLGIYAMFISKLRKQGFFICVISIIWLIFIIKLITPKYALPGQYPYIYGYFAAYGTSISEIANNIILNPRKTYELVVTAWKITYIKDLFLPLFFLPILSPPMLFLTFPVLTINLLASNLRLSYIYSYYHSSITPFLIVATIFGIKRFSQFLFWLAEKSKINEVSLNSPHLQKSKDLLHILLSLALLLFSINLNYKDNVGTHLPFSERFNGKYYEINERDRMEDVIFGNIPATYSVATQDFFVEHVAERKWYFDPSTYERDLPDLIAFDSFRTPGLYSKMSENKDWIPLAQDSFFSLYGRRDLVKEVNAAILDKDLKYFPNNQIYLLVVQPEGFREVAPYGVGAEMDLRVANKFVFAQKVSIEDSDASLIEIPVENAAYEKYCLFKNPFGMFDSELSSLNVRLVSSKDGMPDNNILLNKTLKESEVTCKVGVVYLDLRNLGLNKGDDVWLYLSAKHVESTTRGNYAADRTDVSSDTTFKFYMKGSNVRDENDIVSGYPKSINTMMSNDGGENWKIPVLDSSLIFTVYYGRARSLEKYYKDSLANGTIIVKGDLTNIRSQIKSISEGSSSNYRYYIVGKERQLYD